MESKKYDDSIYGKSTVEDIKNIEQQIVQVRLLSKEKAGEFSKRLKEIREYANVSDLSSGGASEDVVNLINLIVNLEFDITYWQETEGRELQNAKIISDIAHDILGVLERGKDDKNSFMEGLVQIREKWEKKELSHVQKYNLDRGLSSALEKVIKLKIKMGEEIDLEDIDKICSKADLIERMKEALSKKAEGKLEINFEELINSLNEDNFTEARFWQALTGEEDIKFTGTKEESKKAEIVSQKNDTTVVFPRNKRVALHYGTVDENTGEYTIKYTLYKNYSRKCLKADNIESNVPSKYRECNLIGIDIDDKKIEEIDLLEDNILTTNLNFIFQFYKLKFVNIGNSIEQIPDEFFENSKIDVITLGENITIIGQSAFSKSECEKVIMRDKLILIRENAFAKCSKLKSIDIPDSVRYIDTAAFWRCENLENVNLGNKIEIIGEYAFERYQNQNR